MDKIVIFTGSFCPPTKAHFKLMEESMKAVNADKGIFLPTCEKHIKDKMILKFDRLALSGKDRIRMLESFCKTNKKLSVSDYEIQIKDSDNTYKTFKYFKKLYPDSILYYVMGADKLKELPHWKKIDNFLDEFHFIVSARADINAKDYINSNPLYSKYKDHFVIMDELDGLTSVSSTKIREMFLKGDKTYKNYLTEEVSNILENLDMNMYPEVSIYDFIGVKLSKGPFGIVKAGKTVYELNCKLFSDNPYLKEFNVVEEVKDVIPTTPNKNYDTNIIIEEGLEYSDIIKKYHNSILIVEASRSRTGSKYDQGKCDTLEEEICKISNVSMALYKVGMNKLKCVKNSNVNTCNIYPLNNPLYIKDVTLIRHSAKYNYQELDNFDLKVDLMMVPSLNVRRTDNEDLDYVNSDESLTNDGITIMEERLRKALEKIKECNYETVIINAFGTGFKVLYEDSAKIISDVFKDFVGSFKNIVIVAPSTKKGKKAFLDNLKIK